MAQLSIVIALLVLASLVELGTAGSDSMTCGYRAVLKRKTCKCQARTTGDAKFACYPSHDYQFCSISSDPVLTTFDKQKSRIKIPSSISLTDLTTRRHVSGGGKCHLRVNALSKRFGEKYFIEYLEFSLNQTSHSGSSVGETYRLFAEVEKDGEYVWRLSKKEVFSQGTYTRWRSVLKIDKNSPSVTSSECAGCTIKIERSSSKFLVVHITCCSLKFAIRPFNPDKPKIVPGVWIMARKWAWTKPLPDFLCNSNKNGSKIEDLVKQYNFKTKSQVITYIALMKGRPLSYFGSFFALKHLQGVLESCPSSRRTSFMTKADFMFDDGKLIRCLRSNTVWMIWAIAKGYCNSDSSCGSAIYRLETYCPNAKDDNEQIDAFLKNGCV